MNTNPLKPLAAAALAGAIIACGAGNDYASDMAEEHKDDAPVANEVSAATPSGQVVSEVVEYGSIDGQATSGYLAKPAQSESGQHPKIIVIHEWWGLNDNIRSMADQLAGEGYEALAVDLYAGESASDPDGAMQLMRAAMDNSDALSANLVQAYEFLGGDMATIGTIGWCFGGGWSLGAALAMPTQLDASVIYYGRVAVDQEILAPLQVPLLGLFGGEDQGISVDSVNNFKMALDELGKNASIHIYDGADHAFANPSGNNYQKEPAEDAWTKTLAFFEEHLKTSS